MDDSARIYEDISWLRHTPEHERGSSRGRTLIGAAAVMAVAGAVGFGGAVLVHDTATASTATSTAASATDSTGTTATASSLTTTTAVAPQATTSVPTTTSGGS